MPKSGERIGMNIVVYKKDSDEHVSTLWEGIGRILPELARTDVPVVLAVTGAGGKTTCIAALARELMDRGKRVLVVTTTRCDAVLSIAGLSALGRSLQAVCFRWDEAADAARRFGRTFPQEAADGTVPLSISLFARLWQNCCLSGMAWDIPVLPVLNQADTPQHRIAASLIFQEMDLPAGLITSFAGKEGIPCI